MELTKTQKFAVEAKGKNILVSAGAGTGKTRVLVERFIHFVTSGSAAVNEILALTYTEKAANEMKSRILERFRELKLESFARDLEAAYISTIHAFAARILREHPIEAGVDPDFRVMETEEADFLKEQALEEAIEAECRPGTDIFELLRVYGEKEIHTAVNKIFAASRHEGFSLSEFIQIHPSEISDQEYSLLSKRVTALFESLKEIKELKAWQKYSSVPVWTWQTVESYKEWRKSFSRKGGKETREHWQEIRSLCDRFLGLKIQAFSNPWKEKLKRLALLFEAKYESRKKELSSIDFDDLQIKAARLFQSSHSACQRLRSHYQKHFRFIMIDEFQDTNPLQVELIESLSGGNNLFYVGDYKQSIYSFRGAEPAVFLKKEKEFMSGDAGVRIPLLENFRSQEPVLAFINRYFKELWNEDDDFEFEDLIVCTARQGDAAVELIPVKLAEKENLAHGRLREAGLIAQKILELHESGVPYGDMVMLFQAMTNSGIYEQALRQKGIPYFAVSGRGFYHQPEIRDIMSFLAFLENPLSDIALAATLRSPFFHLTDDSLFWLARYAKHPASSKEKKTKGKGAAVKKARPLYEGIKVFEKIKEISESEKEKLRSFTAVTRKLLKEKDRLRLTELLEKIVAKTAYELLVLADPQGARKYANIKKLLNLAREHEVFEPMPIGVFLATIRRLETQEVKESEAQIEAEKGGKVVRLMSVHRAKGLEFPVVFAADLANSTQNTESKMVLAQAGLGFSVCVRNEETFDFEKPWDWHQINEAKARKENEEWKRLFYVAATRAKNQLIFSGVYKEKEPKHESYYEMSSWMDWILFSPESAKEGLEVLHLKESKGGRPKLSLAEKKNFREHFPDFIPRPIEELFPDIAERTVLTQQAANIIENLKTPQLSYSKAVDLPVSAYAAYQKGGLYYRRIYEIGYPDWVVSEAPEKEWETPEEAGEAGAADFGTAMHRILERLDFRNPAGLDPQEWKKCFRGMPEGKVSQAQGILADFLKSGIFKEISQAKQIKRELPFILNERHGLVHGVIDLLYQDERGDWHVVDYKTAVGNDEKISEMGYDLQIQMYAYAVWRILKKTPVSGRLYFLKNSWEYRIDFDEKSLETFGSRLRALQDELIESRVEWLSKT